MVKLLPHNLKITRRPIYHTISITDKEDIFGTNDETWRYTNIGISKHDNDSEEVENVFMENATFIGGKINTKNGEVPPKNTPRKTGIWTGWKVDSPKRNLVFSPEMKVHYFDRDYMEFDDMGHVVEEVEHENAYSENG
ncbi:hypothetical protein Tco_0244532 [Tanacetum coccineum]